MAARRRVAAATLQASSFPTGEEEVWRYSRISDFDLGRFAPLPSGPGQVPSPDYTGTGGLPPLPREVQALLDRVGERAGCVITHDGVVVESSLGDEAELHGVRLAPCSSHPEAERLFGSVEAHFAARGDRDALDALADAFVRDVAVLTVPRSVELAAPIVVVHVVGRAAGDPGRDPDSRAGGRAEGSAPAGGEPRAAAVFPRTVVHLEENAGASVVEVLVSGPAPCLVAPTTELSVADGARLHHDLVQQLGRTAWHFGRLFATAGRDATLRSFQASLGGHYARSRTDSVLTGQGGTAQLLAAYLGDGEQMHDFRTLQEHAAPRTTSDLVFKGAVGGTARSVYSGLIHMRHGARGANAFQTNRNLVLSDGAHADSVPNLDIEENDVRCSHASAVGPIEEEQRFYLESRGVPRRAAERLIVLGFFGELLERVTPAVADHVLASIAGRVSAITGTAP